MCRFLAFLLFVLPAFGAQVTFPAPIQGTAWLSHDGNNMYADVTTNTLVAGTVGLGLDYWDFTSFQSPVESTNFHYTNFHFPINRSIQIGSTAYNAAAKTNAIAYNHFQWEIARYIFNVRPTICSVYVEMMLGPYAHDGNTFDLAQLNSSSSFCSANLSDQGVGTNYALMAHGQGNLNPCGTGIQAGCKIVVTTNIPYAVEIQMFATNAPYYGTNIAVRVTDMNTWTLVGESIYPAVDSADVRLTTDNIISLVFGQSGHAAGVGHVTIFGNIVIDRLGRFPMLVNGTNTQVAGRVDFNGKVTR